jgi:tRNA threonylcarbamoyladenosine biosynthesis protein TsaB
VSVILNIETAIDSASVCLAKNGQPVLSKQHPHPKDSASWIQPAISDLLNETGYTFKGLHAVAVSNGPGSYTGLRVGMATAKGICFALNIPLITMNTLKIMAASFPMQEGWLCPMIDARRMEVFTAVYDNELNEILPPKNMILNDESFIEMIEQEKMVFFGNGSEKFRSLMQHKNAFFASFTLTAAHMAALSETAYDDGQFADLAYSEPFYGKDFFSPAFKPPDQ